MAKSKFPGGRRTGNPAAGARPQTASASAATVTVDDAPAKKKTSPAQFFSQVRAEGRKIIWPSRKETWITSVMVFIMVLLAAAFFWIVDWLLGQASTIVLAIGQ
ncbi:preprotein translocase subunit SecE [Brevundimonas aurifodinae]|uniref:Protein translocase subunit SecE n=2 Tax=Brevundimonas TaxID=41275 RepID=A0ABV1NLD4_9CAUL|nr:MAG: preprotein translocase subunit SecE [Brevundimonas subvibrioides]